MREFIDCMKNEKRKADNTIRAYERDLSAFDLFLKERGAKGLRDCTDNDAVSYVLELGTENKSKSTINRRVSSLKTYYDFLVDRGEMDSNPFSKIRSAKNDRRKIDYLTVEETAALMDLPFDDKKGIRDKALLEFMYGTGARVTEVVRLRFSDVNLRMNFVTLKDTNDESRIVPLGRYAAEAMREYAGEVYDSIKGAPHSDDDFVFINMRGDALTRQGIWKILKDYGRELGIEERMTPQILRDSFAVHILQRGGDLKTIQELMGFDDMTIGIAYLAVTEIHVRDVFSKCHPRA
ncbi:MAG: tyrosine-type recombinase/integrase [Mogibacterium sp.]|nr:tyrosine-type recombinase/integrase [Mogibacterium sp.]